MRLLPIKALALSIAALLAFGQVAQPQGTPTTPRAPFVDTAGESPIYPVGDAIPVYRAVLDLLYTDGDERPGVILMYDSTERSGGGPCPFATCLKTGWRHVSKIDTATILAYATMSAKRPGIRDFGYPIPIVFLSTDDSRRMWADGLEYLAAHPSARDPRNQQPIDGFWFEAARKYPTAWGITTLSKVGFNPQHTEALIQVHQSSGIYSHIDEILFLRRESGHWRVVERSTGQKDVVDMLATPMMRYVGPVVTAPNEPDVLPAPRRGVPSEADARAAVYRQVLDSLYSFDGQRPRTIVLTDAFSVDRSEFPSHGSAIEKSLLERYAFLRRVRASPDIKLGYHIPIASLSRKTVAEMNPPGASIDLATGTSPQFWPAFRGRYPGAWGVVGFTRIAFDTTRSEALVYSAHLCGETCMNGDTWFLKRSGKTWRIVERIPHLTPSDIPGEPLRYLGADASLDTYRPRQMQGAAINARTHLAMPSLSIKVHIDAVSGSPLTDTVINTDSRGHYSLRSLPMAGIVSMKVGCPAKSDHDAILLNSINVRPGTDTTVDLSVDFLGCVDPPTPPPPVTILEGAEAIIGTDEARFTFPLQVGTTYVWDTPAGGRSDLTTYNWYVSWEVPDTLDGKSPQILWLIKRWKPGGPRKGSLNELIAGDTLEAMIDCVTCDGAVFGDPETDHTKVYATIENGRLVFVVKGADAVRHVFPVVPASVAFSASVRYTPEHDYGPGNSNEMLDVPVVRQRP